MLTLLLMAPAFACDHDDHCEGHVESSTTEIAERHDEGRRYEMQLQTEMLGMDVGGVYGGNFTVRGERDGYLRGVAYGNSSGEWITRVSAGADLFPNSDFDLTLGAFAGHAGAWQSVEYQNFLVGVEAGLGFRIDRTWFNLESVGGESLMSRKVRAESSMTIGYRAWDRMSLYLRTKSFMAGDQTNWDGVGVGLDWRW